jgi:ATP-binding cassette, subfamily B, bacterial
VTPQDDELIEEAQPNFDAVSHLQASHRQPRSPRLFLRAVRSALRLSRRASPRLARLNMALQLGAVLLLGLQILFAKLALQAIFDQQQGGGSVAEVLPALVGVVASTGLAGLATSTQTQLQRLLSESVQRSVQSSILGVTTSVPLETFESPDFYDDLQWVQTNSGMQPANLARSLVALLGGALGAAVLAVALFTIGPLLVPVLLLGAIPQTFLSRRQGSLEFDFIVRQAPGHRLRDYLVSVLTGRDEAKEIRAFDLGGPVESRWDTSYRQYISDLRAHVLHRVRLAMFGSLVTFVVTAVSLALLVVFVLDHEVSLASAGAALIAIRLLANRIEMTFTGVTGLFESTLFLQDYESFLARRPAADPREAADAPRVRPFEELRVEDVRFRYPGSRPDALRGISLSIRAGEVVALVGENGSGKTTLAKLLCHVFAPTGGRILWDGVDTRDLPAAAVRRHVGVIFQDFVRYQLSAHENIAFGRADAAADREAVVAAAERGGSHGFLSRLPQGYDTLLGKTFWGGYDLSIGQWQRVAISRAIFRGASFLVLDEPTASLDARSEQRLFEQLTQLAEGRALLLISHRFSTVRSADRIFVLHEGELIEEGSHEELMALGGHYAELFTLQARSYV